MHYLYTTITLNEYLMPYRLQNQAAPVALPVFTHLSKSTQHCPDYQH